MLSQQMLTVFQETLQQKYGPIFQRMEAILEQRRLEYMSHLVDSLEENYRRVGLEKQALDKLESGFASEEVKGRFKEILEAQQTLIKEHIDRQSQLKELQLAQNPKEGEVDQEKVKECQEKLDKINATPLTQVDSDKIKAVTTMIDQFNNIVAKNFSVYVNYNDFTFANSRSADDIDSKLTNFFGQHFSGDF